MKTFVLMEMVYGFPPKPNMTTFTAKKEDSILTEFFEQPSNFDSEFFFNLFEEYLKTKERNEDATDEDLDLFILLENEPCTIDNTKNFFSSLKILDIIKYINSKFYDREDFYFNLYSLDIKTNSCIDLVHTHLNKKKTIQPNPTSLKVNLNTAVPITVTKVTDLFNS